MLCRKHLASIRFPGPRWFLWFSSSWTLRCLRTGNFSTAQENKVPKPGRLNLAQIDFPRMSFHKIGEYRDRFHRDGSFLVADREATRSQPIFESCDGPLPGRL